MAETSTVRSFCRICQGFCGVVVTVEDGCVAQVRGDRADPMSRGFACFKGLQAVEQHYGAGRLLHPLRRNMAGAFETIDSESAIADAGARLRDILHAHGPESVALFIGTQALFNAATPPAINAFAAAIGTPRLYGTMTIDQSAKWIGEARIGKWDAGPQSFDTADVWMFVGSNPLVSMVAGAGANQFAFSDPVKTMKDARARGMTIIVIDPRHSETADFADIVVQPRAGCDALLFAAILHLVLERGWHDQEFCKAHVEGLSAFRTALAPFIPAHCAPLAGVTEQEIERVARVFAHESRSGMAGSGTGPNMARHSNLSEHLIQALNIICGRFPRAGETVSNPGVLQPDRPRRAQAVGPDRPWETGPRSKRHGLGTIRGQMMSATLIDDILVEDAGRIRALICVGGNPAFALPDQARATAGLDGLDLLVVIDPRMTLTARHATHVLPPRLHYERPDHTGLLEGMFKRPFVHVTGPVVAPPEGSDTLEDWRILWGLARALGVPLTIGGRVLSMDVAPATETVLACLAADGGIVARGLTESGGQISDARERRVLPADNAAARFVLLAGDVADEIAGLARELEASPCDAPLPLLLTVRRHREVMNSTGTDLTATQVRLPGNPAYFHPDELAARGLGPGDAISIRSASGVIHARVVADSRLRRGIVAMGHCWPGMSCFPDEATNRLVDADRDVQAINRMPVMTGIAVEVSRIEPGASAG